MARFRDDYKYKITPKGYNVEQKAGESDLQYYRRLAKVADQRLVRLEALSHEKGFQGVEKMAYATAMKDIERYGGGKRFNVKAPEANRVLQEKIQDIKKFLTSPTSTRYGIVETYQKRAETLNQKYGTNFNWKDLADYFGKGVRDKLERSHIESKTALRAVGRIQDLKADIVAGIESNTSITTEGPVNDAVLKILRKQGVTDVDLTKEQKEEIRRRLRKKKK